MTNLPNRLAHHEGHAAASCNQEKRTGFTAEARSTQSGRAATKNSGTGIHHRGAEYTEKCFSLKTIRTQRPPRLRGGFSISSQLANNFDYSSAEFGVFLTKILLLGVLRASALKVVADPSFGGSAVRFRVQSPLAGEGPLTSLPPRP